MFLFLDQTLRWALPVLSHPYMHSLLHRTFFVWLFSMDGKKGWHDYRTWAVVLVACTVVLWYAFRWAAQRKTGCRRDERLV
jgi:hypothetical protein